MRLRGIPVVGSRVVVVFLAVRVGGTVDRVDEDGRVLHVVTDDGEALRFELNAATGTFAGPGPGGPRLLFGDVDGEHG